MAGPAALEDNGETVSSTTVDVYDYLAVLRPDLPSNPSIDFDPQSAHPELAMVNNEMSSVRRKANEQLSRRVALKRMPGAQQARGRTGSLAHAETSVDPRCEVLRLSSRPSTIQLCQLSNREADQPCASPTSAAIRNTTLTTPQQRASAPKQTV